MEGELYTALYRAVWSEASRRPRRKRVRYADAVILLVFFWAVLHDRPVSWACDRRNWPAAERWHPLPSPATMSRRLRSPSVVLLLLLAAVYGRLAARRPPSLVRRADTKPLAVGRYSKDADAAEGYAAGGWSVGYKLACCWGGGVVPDAVALGPMDWPDPDAAAAMVQQLPAGGGGGGGYLLADAAHDSNPLYGTCADRGLQLLAPRKRPGTGLGHREHHPARLRAIDLLEGPSPFGRQLYRGRAAIERRFGQLGNFGGGLAPLPNWVRRPRRVARWAVAKLVVNGLRLCEKHGLAA